MYRTHRMRTALRAYPAVLGERGRNLGTLEQHLPDVLLRRVEELAQSLVLGRVELPQVEVPLLAREDPADEHDVDYVDKLELLACHTPDTFLESIQLHR